MFLSEKTLNVSEKLKYRARVGISCEAMMWKKKKKIDFTYCKIAQFKTID